VIKLGGDEMDGACTGCKVLVSKPEGKKVRNHLGDLGVCGMIILKSILEKQSLRYGMDSSGS
jgi:hypothetical protein